MRGGEEKLGEQGSVWLIHSPALPMSSRPRTPGSSVFCVPVFCSRDRNKIQQVE